MLERLRYVRLPTSNAAISTAFVQEVVGLQIGETGAGIARFRSDDRTYTLEYDASGTTDHPTVAVEVRSQNILANLFEALGERGLSPKRLDTELCKSRHVRDAICFSDFSGNRIELVVRAENKGRRYFPSRDAGIVSFAGVALRSIDIEKDATLWCDVLKAEIRDYVGTSIYLGFNSRHHRVALHKGKKGGLLSITFEVESLDSIMQSQYFLGERQIRIVNGPGREPFSGQIFVSFESPEGYVFTYGTGMTDVAPGWRPRQFADSRNSFCNWGSPVTIPELSRHGA